MKYWVVVDQLIDEYKVPQEYHQMMKDVASYEITQNVDCPGCPSCLNDPRIGGLPFGCQLYYIIGISEEPILEFIYDNIHLIEREHDVISRMSIIRAVHLKFKENK